MERELARKEQLRDTYANQDGEHSLTVALVHGYNANSRNELQLSHLELGMNPGPNSYCTILLYDSFNRITRL